MLWTTIELRIEPDIERIGEGALAIQVQIKERDEDLDAEYRLWRGSLFGPVTSDLMKQAATQLDPGLALSLLTELRSANIAACPRFEVWLHPVVYRLEVNSGFNTAQYSWQEELPEQWHQLGSVVALLKRIAEEARNDA
ncbi:hypothetical protein [Pelomonas sp. SE-A7]|uniref:hypothetical protein n=1 Tax=Pelomonas sp. SE-A7 TaxID=3054953 RepID=UPI00259D2AC9|nr:hypothetical protein [Pelomonas sp. SE-A7]MDM4767199.1 hypothetical protein [Pelomonas sp. SE-A7]